MNRDEKIDKQRTLILFLIISLLVHIIISSIFLWVTFENKNQNVPLTSWIKPPQLNVPTKVTLDYHSDAQLRAKPGDAEGAQNPSVTLSSQDHSVTNAQATPPPTEASAKSVQPSPQELSAHLEKTENLMQDQSVSAGISSSYTPQELKQLALRNLRKQSPAGTSDKKEASAPHSFLTFMQPEVESLHQISISIPLGTIGISTKDGNAPVWKTGNPNKQPTEFDLKFGSYINKIGTLLFKNMKLLDLPAFNNYIEIIFEINREGSLNYITSQSTTSARELEKKVFSTIKKSFPLLPVPPCFEGEALTMRITIECLPDKINPQRYILYFGLGMRNPYKLRSPGNLFHT